jgi:hypothetical protein
MSAYGTGLIRGRATAEELSRFPGCNALHDDCSIEGERKKEYRKLFILVKVPST